MVVSLPQSLASLSSSDDASLSLSLSLSLASLRGTSRGTSRTCCADCVCAVCAVCAVSVSVSVSASHALLLSSRALSSSSGPFAPVEVGVAVAVCTGVPAPPSPFQEFVRESRLLFHSGVAPAAVVGVPTAFGACTVYAVGLAVMVPPSRAMGVRGILPVAGVAGLEESWCACFWDGCKGTGRLPMRIWPYSAGGVGANEGGGIEDDGLRGGSRGWGRGRGRGRYLVDGAGEQSALHGVVCGFLRSKLFLCASCGVLLGGEVASGLFVLELLQLQLQGGFAPGFGRSLALQGFCLFAYLASLTVELVFLSLSLEPLLVLGLFALAVPRFLFPSHLQLAFVLGLLQLVAPRLHLCGLVFAAPLICPSQSSRLLLGKAKFLLTPRFLVSLFPCSALLPASLLPLRFPILVVLGEPCAVSSQPRLLGLVGSLDVFHVLVLPHELRRSLLLSSCQGRLHRGCKLTGVPSILDFLAAVCTVAASFARQDLGPSLAVLAAVRLAVDASVFEVIAGTCVDVVLLTVTTVEMCVGEDAHDGCSSSQDKSIRGLVEGDEETAVDGIQGEHYMEWSSSYVQSTAGPPSGAPGSIRVSGSHDMLCWQC